jgi:pyruvyltransferase
MKIIFCILCVSLATSCFAQELFWWRPKDGVNFGDELSCVIVERMLGRKVQLASLDAKKKIMFGAGSVLHFARDGDVIWGSGFREDPTHEHRFRSLDVRAVRGPRTRKFLLQKGVSCPEVYGDPAILMGHLFPEYKKKPPKYDYIIVPNIGIAPGFIPYKNMVSPTLPWNEIVEKILESKLVISSSLHGIIVAESFGIPTRMLKMSWVEPLLKYQDYYESTGRPNFRFATSVQEALQLGGEKPGHIDIQPLIQAFPWDYFGK